MASISQLTEEERNFTRFFFLNFKVSPDIVRRFFDGVFPPKHLSQTINSSMNDIINLKNTKRINAAQLEILRGVTGTVWPHYLPPMPAGTKPTSSKDFDLTLMVCLLRNLGGLLTPSNGWDQLPHPNDMLPGADLATLKWYRNQLAHMAQTCMDTTEFTLKWTLVEKALTSLNKGQRPHEVTEILNYDLDGEQGKSLANAELKQMKDQYLECEKEKEQIERVLSVCKREKEHIESDLSHYREGNLPKNIADANAILVETWKKDDESFYDTYGSELVFDKVNDFSCILVTSSSGLGKTATIRHIALKLQPDGFEIVSVEYPEDIIKYKTIKKQVFLIDDVLGKYDLNPHLLEQWERINEKLIKCVDKEPRSHKILCTLRSHIALNKRFETASTILNKVVINLEHMSYAPSKEEKQNMLIKHLRTNNLEKDIKREEVKIMCQTNYAFPLLCKLVSNDEERFRKRIDFFRQPLSLFMDELNKMSYENKKLYCILVICMLFNGSFSRSIFSVGHDEKISTIMQTCGLLTNMSTKELEDSTVSAVGSYFTEDRNNFRFIHDALEETVGYHFYNFNPRVMFSYCNILFIKNRVRIYSDENKNESVDENIVTIREDELSKDCLTTLYTRMCTELCEGRFSSLLTSSIFKNRNFVRIFGIHFENNQRILGPKNKLWETISSERSKNCNQSLFNLVFGFRLFHELTDVEDAIRRVIRAVPFRSTLMYWIVAFGCNELFQYAWRKMSTLDHKRILSRDYICLPSVKSFFPLAVLGGNLDIVKELIYSGADVNCFSEFWETPLYLAIELGRDDMVSLLVNNGAQISKRRWFTMNIPIAVSSNKQELISLILEYDLNKTQLHDAVRKNDLENLRSNIRSENIDSKTKSGWTVLHYAVLLNNFEAVKVLFHEELSKNDDYYLDVTPNDKDKFMSRMRTPKLNIVDNNGLTAVHLAVITNNIEILSLLLHYKVEVKVRDFFDRTPLHYIKSVSAAKLLLTYCFRNKCLETNRNAEEEIYREQTPMSPFMTICLNITIQTTFRNVGRDVVNLPDREGNTPLHSVISKSLLDEESSECIKKLLENGANPYLFNDSRTSALELFKIKLKSTIDTYTNDNARYKQSIKKTSRVISLIMCFLIVFACIPYLYFYLVIGSQKIALFCDSQATESSNIPLFQVTRNINIILLILIVGFWMLSITFNMRYSDHLRRYFYLFIVLILLGCVFLKLYGTFVISKILSNFFITMIVTVVLYSIQIKIWKALEYITIRMTSFGKIGNVIGTILYVFIMFLFIVPIVVFFMSIPYMLDQKNLDTFYSIHKINTMNITAVNCTELRSVNISCTSSFYDITYKNDTDFYVQCRPDIHVISYDRTYGTLLVESGLTDLSEIGLTSLLCLLLSLQGTCGMVFARCVFIKHV